MPKSKRFQYYHTPHFVARAEERGIKIAQCEKLISSGKAIVKELKPGKNGGYVYRFSHNNKEDELIVLAEIKKDECWLITTHWGQKYA